MTLIEDLTKSISQMSDEELYERIKELRAARRVAAPVRRAKANKRSSAATSNLSPESLLASMNPEEIEALLQQLEEES